MGCVIHRQAIQTGNVESLCFFFFFLQHQLNGTGNCSGFSDCIQMYQKRISVGLERITSYMAYVSMHLEQRPGSRSGAKTVNAVISGLNLH